MGRASVLHGGPPASGLPWWTPIAVSAVLLLLALGYVLRHRKRRTAEDGAPEANGDGVLPLPRH